MFTWTRGTNWARKLVILILVPTAIVARAALHSGGAASGDGHGSAQHQRAEARP